MQEQWRALLSDSRVSRHNPAEAEPPEHDPLRSAFEADYDRVIYSTPFRRLARKTQVHPLALNDHVRTRLTHSLEVGCVGRSLGKRLAGFLLAKGHMPVDRNESHLIWIMLSACAAHDIGNPPFGHAGEYAIREWVTTHETEVFERHEVSPGVRADLALFEGNAQGFRIAARADNSKTGYLRLTYATLGAMIKYPWHSEDKRAQDQKKFNVFSTERPLFEAMTKAMGLGDTTGACRRHPMSFLTEAADDICYRILDLEDAVEIGILDEKRVREVYAPLLSSDTTEHLLAVLRGQVIRALIEGVWSVFEQDYSNIMNGTRSADLKSGLKPPLARLVAEIKNLYKEIFAERSKVAAELGAYKALGRIVKALCAATRRLAERGNYDNAGFLSQRCLELAWGEGYARAHETKSFEWWLHQVMDYVSGLTDNYARQLSREIEGT